MTAEEEAAGGDVAAAAVTTLALTITTQLMAGYMEWYPQTSGRVYLANNLKSLGAMVACMFPTSTRVIRIPTTYRRFSKAEI